MKNIQKTNKLCYCLGGGGGGGFFGLHLLDLRKLLSPDFSAGFTPSCMVTHVS